MAPEPAPNGCTGLCCAAFFVPYTLTELRQGVAPDTGNQLAEADVIASIVVPLTPKQARERHEAFGGTEGDRFVWAERGHHFTCHHFDDETRRCTIYEDRPGMCRTYPNDHACTYGGEACACEGSPWPDE